MKYLEVRIDLVPFDTRYAQLGWEVFRRPMHRHISTGFGHDASVVTCLPAPSEEAVALWKLWSREQE